MELLLGCGSRRNKQVWEAGNREWSGLITLDKNPSHQPDILWDLEKKPWPFDAGLADEVHMYDVLEHLGRQGDEKAFFSDFLEIWRILKPGGILCATVPHWNSPWTFGDPGHRRVINPGSLVFLDQDEYARQVGISAMTDYRNIWRGDFKRTYDKEEGHTYCFILKAVKPPS